MIKPYFNNGVLSEKFEAITPGFIEALSIGFIRYIGDSRTSKSGMERPLSVLFSHDDSENSKTVHGYFKDAFNVIGIDHQLAKNLSVEELKQKFFDEEYDSGILIRSLDDAIEIEIFERGDDIGGLEASLPGGVNFEGKVKSVNYALPIPQIAVNHIEHALNTETGFDVLK
ncbi:hypothetical protein J6X90_00775 [Candidatus Saccharibacteria bacterium]|nr:hypothetical protein [Candidatus Saccharibacteria bacterium]